MSQDLRQKETGNKDVNVLTDGFDQKNYDGFEGMNYEQKRQPFNPKHKDRNSTDERKNGQRPDES